jgi:tetratricopeptide (TPR) repeat protein
MSHELHLARFTANPDDRVAFEYLEEHLFMQADWPALADLYRRRCAAPSLQSQARQRAELFMRLAQVCEDRLGEVDAAIAAYSEAVALEPKLRRALRQLRTLFQARGSWEAVLQISEQEAGLAGTREERARAYVEMADVWRRHLGDPEQAELFYARARLEGWRDPHAGATRAVPGAPPAAAAPVKAAPPAQPAPPAQSAQPAPNASPADEFEFYDDLEVDLEVDLAVVSSVHDSELAEEPVGAATQPTLTMPEFDAPTGGEQRSARVLSVLERKLASREARGAGLDAESVHLRLRIADLYKQLGRSESLMQLLREELPRAERDRELELQLELASLAAESLGDPAGALPHLRRCLELEPTRADLLERALSACAVRGGRSRSSTWSSTCASAPEVTPRAPRCSRGAVRCSPTRSRGTTRPARAGAPHSRSIRIRRSRANGSPQSEANRSDPRSRVSHQAQLREQLRPPARECSVDPAAEQMRRRDVGRGRSAREPAALDQQARERAVGEVVQMALVVQIDRAACVGGEALVVRRGRREAPE